jgi:hypothetical protein
MAQLDKHVSGLDLRPPGQKKADQTVVGAPAPDEIYTEDLDCFTARVGQDGFGRDRSTGVQAHRHETSTEFELKGLSNLKAGVTHGLRTWSSSLESLRHSYVDTSGV